jgi:hypothetical protein
MAGFRFTLSHEVLGDKVISEPDGWKGAKIILERHPEFMSLVEYYEGAANGGFIFYGNDGRVDGGIDYIKEIEQTYGFDARIDITIEYSPDGFIYETLFEGQLDLSAKNELKDNRMQVPVIRDDFWAKFINRMDTPVDLSSLVDLDGNAVDPVTPIETLLTFQRLRQTYEGHHSQEETIAYDIPDNQYGQIDFATETISEIDEKFNLPRLENSAVPSELFAVEYAGNYAFDIAIYTAVGVIGSNATDSNLQIRIQINDNAATVLTQIGESSGIDSWTKHVYNATVTLNKGDQIRLYFYNNNATGASYQFNWLAGVFHDSYMIVRADTVYPSTQAQGYLIHDLIHGVLARYGLGTNPFYSEYLGGEQTTARQYNSDGCFWNMGIFKGLQIRQYDLSEKPFFISFKQIWDGINPIANLGLGYEDIEGEQVIRIEEKAHFFNETTSFDIGNVREISSTYAGDHIFKTVKVGYRKWQSENSSGIDDPQSKRVYATRFLKTGKEINLESDFIAASLAIETARRKVKEKTADYKFDNDNFIIALRFESTSPSLYYPEANENFNSIAGLLNSSTRYNLILTPMRNLLRWGNYLAGCLQSYTSSVFRFVSGEGNYDMASDYDCPGGLPCQAVLCGNLSESGDITVSDITDYLFVPMEYTVSHSLRWDDFTTIREFRKNAIGLSQADSSFASFFINKLEYDLISGEQTLTAMPKRYFNIQVIEQEYQMSGCATDMTSGGSGEDIDTCYRITEDELVRITEDGNIRIPEDCEA